MANGIIPADRKLYTVVLSELDSEIAITQSEDFLAGVLVCAQGRRAL